jgi:hypothetical protein
MRQNSILSSLHLQFFLNQMKAATNLSLKDKKVLSSGADPAKVFSEAKSKGAKDPVVFYVPEKDMVHIY